MKKKHSDLPDLMDLPFNRLIGLERCAAESGFLVSLPALHQYANHIGTVHAVALLAVAEAGSAEFLLQHLNERRGFVPVVRRIESKFRNPAHGRVSARVTTSADQIRHSLTELTIRGRALVSVPVEVVDEAGTVALTASIDWFIARAGDFRI